jgi:tripartite ATP-independent transporter DctM subunit
MIDPTATGIVSLIGMLLLLLAGVPVGLSLGTAGFAGLILGFGWDTAISQVYSLPYHVTAQYVFTTIPMFVLMGNLAASSGMARELYEAADRWFGHMRGGLYISTIAASAAFGAASGSSVVNTTVFTRIALPEMLRLGYSKRMSIGCIASVGTLDAMIPPSIVMVIYGIICEVSVGKLFMAGMIPGLLSVLGFVILVRFMVHFRPALAPAGRSAAPWGERLRALLQMGSVILLFGILMGGIYFGFFAASAAGAFGAFATVVLLLCRRKLTAKGLLESLQDAALITAMLFVIIIGGLLFSRMLLLTGVVSGLVDAVKALQLGPVGVVVLFSVVYLVLGVVMEEVSMMVVTLPFVFPIIQSVGIDPIWFGIIVVQLIQIAMITPPIGLTLFAAASAARGLATMEDIFRGVTPFVFLSIAIWAVLVAFPQLSLWLPNSMIGK